MMQQFQEIKAENRDAILFFRLGDFYEMFGPDAIEASKILDITLTARNKKNDNPIPMCGIPYHAAENYIARLTKAGKKVAICDQVSDPSLPGIVRRKVVRVITPGTTYNEQVLNQKANHYVMSVFPQRDYFGIAFADLTTGEFYAAEFQSLEALKTELIRIDPVEMVVSRDHYDDPELRTLLAKLIEVPLSACELYDEAPRLLRSHFKVTSLEGFGLANHPFATQAAGVLLRYLLDTQKTNLPHVDRIQSYHRDKWMFLDESTIRNLELFSTMRDQEKEGTLLSVLDQTKTSMGGRMMRRWLLQPLLRRTEVESRHDAVDNLVKDDDLRHDILDQLNFLTDLERLLARLSASVGNARDLISLGLSLEKVPHIKSALQRSTSRMLITLGEQLSPLEPLTELIFNALVEEPPVKLTEGRLFKDGHNAELDELNTLIRDAKSALRAIEAEEKEKTGISSLKIGFNKVFGYYIEVSKINQHKVPETYIRKQTLANAERYITPELKEYEEKVLTASEKAKHLEYDLFLDLREQTLRNVHEIQMNAHLLAELDVLGSYSSIAIQKNYCRPELVDDEAFVITNGRHPVVENMTFEQSFVPNDAQLIGGETNIKLITGPNMSGKSTYLRQVALIALMAQIGSFVPAERVQMHLFDRIFTRVGASDNLVRGQSTFMVEMQESANILNHATQKSLIILDEVGRGTSTYDGLSIAWSMVEYLHDHVKGFTLFATHYHELIALADKLECAGNFSIDVQETKKGVLFLHKIKQGGVDRSYGIEVGKLAGLPTWVTERAEEILHSLETKKVLERAKVPENQLDLFSSRMAQSRVPGKLTHPAIERLKSLHVDQMTPLEALNILNELKALKEDEV
ncbi:MAG: DNA mismatch repair protein MutS [Oceanicoccus sp.]|jgi:DNA mismatch repair protein MutS